MFPFAPYNAKPAPIHSGDFDAVGFSTALLTSSGYAAIVGGSGQAGAAAKPAAGIAQGGLGSQLVAIGALGLLLLYLDHRIAR
jgi:hypothetical protein